MAKSKRPNVTTARIAKLYKQHKSYNKVAKIVGRHITSVRLRLVRAGIVK